MPHGLLRKKLIRKVSAPLWSVLNVCHWHTVPANSRNLQIYCVNCYFLMFGGA